MPKKPRPVAAAPRAIAKFLSPRQQEANQAYSKELLVIPTMPGSRKQLIELDIPEVVHTCAVYGSNDVARVSVAYIPDKWIIESLDYIRRIRSWTGTLIVSENLVQHILDELITGLEPQWVRVQYTALTLSSTRTTITASWSNPNFASDIQGFLAECSCPARNP